MCSSISIFLREIEQERERERATTMGTIFLITKHIDKVIL